MSTPAADRAQQGRRVAAVTAQRFPRRQGAFRNADGSFRGPRPAAFAATGQEPPQQRGSTAFGGWADLAAGCLPEGCPEP